ncbi:MAG: malectin [Desulfobacteraceae bacterium]|jgi:hypothetical protein
MTKKMIFTVSLVALTLLLQYGCNGPEVAEEPTDTAQIEVAVAAEPAAAATENAEEFVLRVDCGSYSEYTDDAGNVWQADQEKTDDNKWGAVYGSVVGRSGLGIEGSDCPIIYENERYSMDAYEFDVPNGKYTVTLHFAETYEGIYGEGERVFNVSINGKEVLKDLDPYKEAGDFNTPAVKEFKGIEPADGKITIGFTYGVENPQINGIEIVSE